MTSPNLTEANVEKLCEVFPEVVTESVDDSGEVIKSIDFDLLRQLFADRVVEGPQERYQLDWPGKRAAAFAANTPIAKTLRPNRDESVEFDKTQNLFIEGDNLEVLKLLQESYLGKVKMIYIDPPYNTGNDFVYDDDFAESADEYLLRSYQVNDSGERLVANPEAKGRFHSDWLGMMYPRLKLARNLLAKDGVIFISIDDGEHSGIIEICREIFGGQNYLGSVARVTKRTSNKGDFFAPSKDYVVAFSRDQESVKPFKDIVPEEYAKRFSAQDERGRYATVGLYQASLDPLRGCSNQRYWIEAPDGTFLLPPGPNRPDLVRDGENLSPESRDDRVWRWSYQSYLAKKDLLVFKETDRSPLQDENGSPARWNVYTKYYLDDRLDDGIRPRDFLDSMTNDKGATALKEAGMAGLFDFAKPPQLISRLLTWIDDDEALVLDFFAGSGTTAHAVLAHNSSDGGSRRFLLIQLDETPAEKSVAANAGYSSIAEVSRERVRRAGKVIAEGHEGSRLDVGFRFLAVDTSCMDDNLAVPDATHQLGLSDHARSVKSDRTPEDLLFQVMLDLGLELSLPIERSEVDGFEVMDVEGGALILCVRAKSENLAGGGATLLDMSSVLAEQQPLRIVFLDEDFANDAERINVEQVFREKSPATEVKAI